MLDQLDRLTEEVAVRHHRLVLVVGASGTGKSAVLRGLGDRRSQPVLNLGIDLARRLSAVPKRQRPLQAGIALRESTASGQVADLVILDNLEVLFDKTLQLDPLDALKRQSYGRTVVAAWPGELVGTRLTYAPARHPEHQDYTAEGLILFQI